MTTQQSRSVRDHFERVSVRWGEGYDPASRYMSHLDLRDRRLHVQALLASVLDARASPLRVLDLGCGTGDVLEGVSRERIDVVGIDVSRKVLAVAAEAHPEDSFAVGDATRAPFRAETFDVIVSAGVMEYVPDPSALLRGAHRLLRREGSLILSIPNRASLLRNLSHLEEACERPLSRLWRWARRRPASDRRRARYRHTHWTPWGARRLLRSCGFAARATLYNTYGMRGWLGNTRPSLRLSAWMTERFSNSEAVSAWLAHTVVFKAERLD